MAPTADVKFADTVLTFANLFVSSSIPGAYLQHGVPPGHHPPHRLPGGPLYGTVGAAEVLLEVVTVGGVPRHGLGWPLSRGRTFQEAAVRF